jgi:hypothetical protein
MSLSIIQSSKWEPTTTSTTIPMSLALSPIPGNLVIAYCAYSQFGSVRTIDTPEGWTKIDDTTNTNDSLAFYYRTVFKGDTGSYTWTVSGTAERTSGVIIEIEGAYNSAPDGYLAAATGGASTTFVTPELTPGVLSCMAFGAMAPDAGGANTDTVSEGWTIVESARATYHPLTVAVRDALTTDTETAITTTITSKSSIGVVSTLLVEPKRSPLVGEAFVLPMFSRSS